MTPSDSKWAAHVIAKCASTFIPRVDAERISAEITSRLSSRLNYCARTEDSVLITMANETPFTDKRVSSIDALVVGKPGDGVKLLRDYLRWWKGKPAIRGIVWSPMFDWDSRFEKMTVRLGFTRVGSVFQIWR